MNNPFQGKVVLITGGAGSIGSALVDEALAGGAASVRLLDHNEYAVFQAGQQRAGEGRLRLLLGDIRDAPRMLRAAEGVDIVYHAAALKHVPLCEYNPFEALQTNAVGTQNCIDAALAANAEKFVLVSTDKAVSPSNTMGATKLLAERLVVDAEDYTGFRKTSFACVRFGNVIGSRGSVVETFRNQLETGSPVTITDEGMTRFVMPLRDATRLIGLATALMKGGEVFILKMGCAKVMDLAQAVALASTGRELDPSRIRLVGRRPGEKLHEDLMTEDEARTALETKDLYVSPPAYRLEPREYGAVPANRKTYCSGDGPFLSAAAIARLLPPE